MQEYINFSIKVTKGFDAVAACVKEYFEDGYEGLEAKDKRWVDHIQYDRGSGRIFNAFEGKMYFFDYEEWIFGLVSALKEVDQTCKFMGNVEYYCDDWDEEEEPPHCDFSFANGAMEVHSYGLDDEMSCEEDE